MTVSKGGRCNVILIGLISMLISISIANAGESEQTAVANDRIVVLFPQVLGAVYILGLQNSVVGIPKDRLKMKKAGSDSFYYRLAPELGKATDVGYPSQPNMETIFSLNPSIVLSTDEKAHPTPANKILRKQGIKVLELKAGFGSIQEWLGTIRLIARETRTEGRALRYEAFFRDKLNLVKERISAIPEHKRPKVALVNTFGGELVVRGTRTKYAYELIKAAGGRGMDVITGIDESGACGELMFAFDPDIIIDDTLTDILNTLSWWKSLTAVKAKKVFRPPQDDPATWITNWYMNTFSPLGLLWLAKTFHPDVFSDIDLNLERENFYREIFLIEYRPYPDCK